MSTGKKILNVFGIILAWILSIALVIMLIVSPLIMSALSILKPETITNVMIETLTSSFEEALKEERLASTYELKKLSDTTTTGASVSSSDITQMLPGIVEEMFGQSVDQEIIDKILGSDLVKDVAETYIDSVVSEFTGGNAEGFDSDTVKEIINDNIDEITQIATEIFPEANINTEELKGQIEEFVNSQEIDQVLEFLPDPKDMKQELMQSSPELETALGILEMKDQIIGAMIGVMVVLSVLIFVCRLFGFRGFRWLATDLFIGAAFGALFSVLFSMSNKVLETMGGLDSASEKLVIEIASAFATSMWIHTAIMLVAGAGLLVCYIFIKKARAKKMAVSEAEEDIELPDAVVEITE